jgi:hypothetical protein
MGTKGYKPPVRLLTTFLGWTISNGCVGASCQEYAKSLSRSRNEEQCVAAKCIYELIRLGREVSFAFS